MTISTLERRLKQAERIAKIGHWELDLVKNHLYWSEEIYRIFELDPSTFTASYQGFLAAVHPEDRTAVDQAFSESLKTREPYSIHHRLRMPDGRIKHVHERCETAFGPDGAPLISRGTVQDVTEMIEAEKKNGELQQQVYHSAKLASVGELAAGVGHEINNPLMVIGAAIHQLESELQARGVREGRFEELLKRQADAVDRIRTIVNALRLYSRADEERNDPFELNVAVHRALDLVQSILKSHGIEVRLHLATPSPLVTGAIGRLQQVMVNLLNNSRDALVARPQQLIEISTRTRNGRAEIEVRDTGAGIDPAILPKIRDSFFTTKEPGKGTGLGLSISSNIVSRMKGEMRISSEVGVGTSVLISIPSAEGPLPQKPKSRPSATAAAGKPLASNARVLLIDDEEMIVSSLAMILSHSGFEVVTRSDALSALPVLREQGPFDLILCDLTLPKLTGIEFLAKVRAEGQFRGKAILMTGKPLLDKNEANADRLLFKPFQIKDLLETIRDLLSSDSTA